MKTKRFSSDFLDGLVTSTEQKRWFWQHHTLSRPLLELICVWWINSVRRPERGGLVGVVGWFQPARSYCSSSSSPLRHRLLGAAQPAALTLLLLWKVVLSYLEPPPSACLLKKSNIGQKGRPTYSVSLIIAVNGRVIGATGAALFQLVPLSWGSGTEDAALLRDAALPSTIKINYFSGGGGNTPK